MPEDSSICFVPELRAMECAYTENCFVEDKESHKLQCHLTEVDDDIHNKITPFTYRKSYSENLSV